MIVLAIPFGLRSTRRASLVVLGLLALIGLGSAPLSYAAALILKSEDAFAPLVKGIAMPLLLLSGILLPMALAPDWLQTLSSLNPFTHAVDAARAAVQRPVGRPGDRDRRRHHGRLGGHLRLDRGRARSAAPTPSRPASQVRLTGAVGVSGRPPRRRVRVARAVTPTIGA